MSLIMHYLCKMSVGSFFLLGLLSTSLQPYCKFKRSDDVLKLVKSFLPSNPVIIEAGAYDGKDSVRMAKYWPAATIYTFEPVPELYKKVLKNTSDYKNIYAYSFALGTKTGNSVFYVSSKKESSNKPSASSSLLSPYEHLQYAPHIDFAKKIIVQTMTIDDWAKKNGVKKIDFMWLDLQGAELDVLKASLCTLKTVTAIFTEVEFVEAYKGQPLYRDVKSWLNKMGFVLIAADFTESKVEKNKKKKWYGNVLFIKKLE